MTERDYSGTPLPRKLGIAEGDRVAFVGAPPGFADTLGNLPDGARVVDRARTGLDVILLFVSRAARLETAFPRQAARLKPDGGLWVAYPKRAAKVDTDLSFGEVQRIALAGGLVDNKSCAIDETWTAVRFVLRLADRPPA